MCGILSIAGARTDRYDTRRIDHMLGTLARRGPDDRGTLPFPRCILGQTRLSIIDLSTGHQPMCDNAKKIAIAFNGEIYNYKSLREDLTKKGHRFSTTSDTEAILKAYIEYGDACPKHLDGMFAFVIWDDERQRLFMARDRFGKKPLYYAFDAEGNLLVASEIKAILASGNMQGEIDPAALDQYLALMYVPPTRTIYKNIYTLLPAESAVHENSTLTKHTYWQLDYAPSKISYGDAKEEIRRLFTEAVKKRLVADVEIGSFLSGGVDSTLVTAYAQRFSPKPLKTFALGYGDYRNELPYAETAAKTIGTDHYTTQASEDLLGALEASMAYFDEPHADSSDFPQSLLSEFAAKKVKVALSGDGADELFMGYGWYQKHWHLSYRKHPFEKIFLNPFQGYLRNISIFTEQERRKLQDDRVHTSSFVSEHIRKSGLNPITKINLFDLTTYLPGQLLTKVDRMGMMHGLEVRSPFLDHELAEFVYNLPIEFKMNSNNENKIILKEILAELLPHEFVYRRKQGFGAPVAQWLQTEVMRHYVHTHLAHGARLFEYLDEGAVTELLESFYSGKNPVGYYKVWLLLCLQLWLESHVA